MMLMMKTWSNDYLHTLLLCGQAWGWLLVNTQQQGSACAAAGV
jgi:hypothetical protein